MVASEAYLKEFDAHVWKSIISQEWPDVAGKEQAMSEWSSSLVGFDNKLRGAGPMVKAGFDTAKKFLQNYVQRARARKVRQPGSITSSSQGQATEDAVGQMVVRPFMLGGHLKLSGYSSEESPPPLPSSFHLSQSSLTPTFFSPGPREKNDPSASRAENIEQSSAGTGETDAFAPKRAIIGDFVAAAGVTTAGLQLTDIFTEEEVRKSTAFFECYGASTFFPSDEVESDLVGPGRGSGAHENGLSSDMRERPGVSAEEAPSEDFHSRRVLRLLAETGWGGFHLTGSSSIPTSAKHLAFVGKSTNCRLLRRDPTTTGL